MPLYGTEDWRLIETAGVSLYDLPREVSPGQQFTAKKSAPPCGRPGDPMMDRLFYEAGDILVHRDIPNPRLSLPGEFFMGETH